MYFICLSLLVQVLFLFSIFDIHFKSPVIQNIQSIENRGPALAKRAVLFIVDGLRVDKFFNLHSEDTRGPFLRNIVLRKGVWGISRTRVPTESRPGHVAIIAGLYEDPSAVFKGWKDNPVEFDSVFNQSHRTYAWGSPDIVPMFAKGSATDRVRYETYAGEDQDFSSSNNNSTGLDLWVLQKFEHFLNNAEFNNSLKNDLHMDRLIFFFHLLGTDVAGHASKPHSKDYERNIIVADKVIEKIVHLIDSFYKDNATAFIFTSDHGMTDWGSHGAGSIEETETPFIAWGSGITGPKESESSSNSLPWELDRIRRQDINQADIAPFMAVLIGVPIPINSVGVLPFEFINANDCIILKALYLNVRQIGAQYKWHQQNIKNNAFPWMEVDYLTLSNTEYESKCKELEHQILQNVCPPKSLLMAKNLIELSLAGMQYYEHFYCQLLQFMVTLSFLGWICCLICDLLHHTYSNKGAAENSIYLIRVNTFFLCLITSAVFLIYVQSLPSKFYIYLSLPIVLWWWVFHQAGSIAPNLLTILKNDWRYSLYSYVAYFVGIEALVSSFFYRKLLSLVMTCLILWILINFKLTTLPTAVVIWVISAACLAVFPFLPTVGSSENGYFVLSCGFLWVVGVYVLLKLPNLKRHCTGQLTKFKLSTLTCSIINIFVLLYEPQVMFAKLACQAVSWILTGISVILLFCGGAENIFIRYIQISLSLEVPYLLLSIGHEAYFTFFLTLHLLSWISLEYCLSWEKKFGEFTDINLFSVKGERTTLTEDDFRRSFFFLFYVLLSFFGIGNIASLNSFDTNWVKNFISVFSPFIMTTLILLKTIIPFLLVTIALRFINLLTKSQQQNMFKIVLLYCNIMSLNFFFKVSNKGSWLDIGMSISHYVIMQSVTIFLLGLYELSKLITYSQAVDLLPKQS